MMMISKQHHRSTHLQENDSLLSERSKARERAK